MSKSNNWSGGRLKEIKRTIENKFGDELPIVDAKNDIRLTITSADIEKSRNNQKDFEHCVFAESCKRLYNSTEVLIMKKVSYMEMSDEKGNHQVERFMNSKKAQEVIKDFDMGDPPPVGTTFIFRAPEEYETLEYNRKRQKKFWQKRKKEKKKAKMNVKMKDNQTSEEKSKERSKTNNGRGMNKEISQPKEHTLDIRKGQGLIQTKKI